MRHAPRVILVFLGVAVAVAGCGEGDGVSDTKVSAQSVKVDPRSAFADVLGPGPTTTPDGKAVTVAGYLLGQLSLPSGRLVAADGLFFLDAEPFTRSVKPGTYPVTVAVALLTNALGHQRIAFAQVRFSDHRVAKWEIALTPGQDPSKLKADWVYGYGVDSGTGCFADPGAREFLNAGDGWKLFDEAKDEMKKSYQPTREWVVIDTPKGSAALFTSGLGDGTYASYFGLDDQGEPVALITDFEVVDWKRRP